MSTPDLTVDPAPTRDRDRYRPQHQQSWADSITEYWSQIRLIDFLLGLGLLFNSFALIGAFPFGVVLSALIIAVATWKRPQTKVPSGGLLLLAGLSVFAYLALVSVAQGTDWMQRITRFVLILGVAAAVASRRIDHRSFIVGACFGLMVNVPAYYAGLTPDNYPPYLTGWFGDKNVSGFHYALIGVLGLLVMSKRWALGWIAAISLCLFLTGSRTAMSAWALALAWIFLRNKVSPVMRLVLTGAAIWLWLYVEETFARAGVFSDRAGTDWFRERIDEATVVKMDRTPWSGLGLNEGFVVLEDELRMFMHSSYDQAFVEGGYVFLVATVLAFGLLGLGLLDQARVVSPQLLIVEAAVVVTMVCAAKLGEVFMTTGAFIVLGLAVSYRLGQPLDDPEKKWLTQ